MTPLFNARFSKKALTQWVSLGTLSLVCGFSFAEVGNPKVNQIGYLPNGSKIATYRSSAGPQQWQLKQNGVVVASGTTSGASIDPASGDSLQQIDMSAVTATGNGFTLTVGADTSFPFSIKADAFNGALYDSLRYFYHNRSGIAIETRYTGGGNGSYGTDSKWSRPAGHVGASPNQGDYNVPCWSGLNCGYTLSPIKGWYDAGDHGKYVVNGGISAWTLLNMYERNQYLVPLSKNLDDGKFNIPESANGVADILDEARWEVEFMLAMQVPANQPKGGMVHHKMHDVGWTGFPLRPDQDTKARALVQPSTAATLNLAAVAAQSARIWKNIDSGFANQCLEAAKRAWDAAKANPSDYYNASLYGTDNGGGGYGDNKVTDEFYWAAAELYLTTGDSKYLSTLTSYGLSSTDWSWQDTELAGLVSLATVTTSQTASLQASAKQRILTLANTHVTTQNASGYSTPLGSAKSDYDWGSNSTVLNRMILMGLAYDFSNDSKYANGLIKASDYLFGRNYFSTSFVTGEGSRTMSRPHHRFWSNSVASSFPTPPPGAISGGPNSASLVGSAEGGPSGCDSRPATCWKDDLGAYGVNEITINWNAPLAWVLNWKKDYAEGLINSGSSSSSSSSSVASSSSIASSKPSSSASSAPSSSSSSVKSSSSVASSSVVSSSSSSSSSSVSAQQCNWWGTLYPVCVTTTSGWGYEQGRSCISVSTCTSQPAPYGLVGGASSSSISSSVKSSSSSVVSSSSSTPSSVPSSSSSSSSSSNGGLTPIVTIEAENYAAMSGIQTEATGDIGGGLNVGWIDSGDWLSYTNVPVIIPQTGTYTIEFRVASAVGGGVLAFEEAGGTPSYGTVSINSTNGWQMWKTVKMTVPLTAGTHRFGLNAKSGGFNINWFSITQGVK